jgi:hypothetical protein
MLEFVFFNPRPRQRFAEFLRQRGVGATELDDARALGIGIAEDTDDALLDDIEAFYDKMMVLDQAIVDGLEYPDHRTLCDPRDGAV